MGLENADYIPGLVETNPTGQDPKSEGDDHLRMIKRVLQNQFPNFTGEAVTATEEELNKAIIPVPPVTPAAARKNYLINGNFLINQRGFGGGQPAAGVYGYDRWKGDPLGTRIEQIVENTESINEEFTISWDGGTGTASVNGVNGFSSGDTFVLTTSSDFSVTVPTDATNIQLEKGDSATAFEYRPIGEELALCQRYYQRFGLNGNGNAYQYSIANVSMLFGSYTYPVTLRDAPTLTVLTVPSYNNCSGVALVASGVESMLARGTVTTTNRYRASNGEFEADAEL